ncbi:DUF2771 domain-containing protein [Mycobacterium sp. MMS18-G62]
MKRILAALAVVVVVASVLTGVLIWRLTRDAPPQHPEISAYSHGHLTRVGPYRYCEVLNLNNCQTPETIGELAVDARFPVQLSVPPAISRAPWVLLRAYEGSDEPVVSEFRPGTRLAVTIPTVDAHHGKLTGLVVQLPTLVRDEAGNEFPLPHAEWSVRTVWS